MADRYRIFLAAAAGSVLLCIVLLLFPHTLWTLGLAAVSAIVAAVCGLLALTTWWAEGRGMTDGGNLWDEDTSDTDPPEQVFRGFHGFGDDDGPNRAGDVEPP